MSQTGIGKTGQYHILTSTQDDALFRFNGAMWCTHPLIGDVDILDGGSFDLVQGKKNVVGVSTDFTRLCNNIQNNNIPINKYIACYIDSTTTYLILEVDYVISPAALILKYPAFITATVDSSNDLASQINQFGTPLLKEVVATPVDYSFGSTLAIANKYSSNTGTTSIVINQSQSVVSNEGGVEPMLIIAENIVTRLNY